MFTRPDRHRRGRLSKPRQFFVGSMHAKALATMAGVA
jgi:hypothetical protein